MSDNTNGTTPPEADKKKPRVVKHIDERIKDLQEDIAEANTKLARLLIERDGEAAVSGLKKGDAVTFEFGRADSRRIESGTILAVAINDKGVRQFNVLTGEGIDTKTLLIASSNVLATAEAVEAARADIAAYAAAKPERDAAAAAEAAKNKE